jgi:hypothetical protein
MTTHKRGLSNPAQQSLQPTPKAARFWAHGGCAGLGAAEARVEQLITFNTIRRPKLRYTFSMQKSMPSVKTAISLKRQLFQQVDKIARDQKLPRSRVFVLALEAYVAQYQNQILLSQINETYTDGPDAVEKRRSKATRKAHRRIVEGEW